jgi:D-3-phosphoglycerate dehydrogenase
MSTTNHSPASVTDAASAETPAVLFIDRYLEVARFAEALGPAIHCRTVDDAGAPGAVVALVTAAAPVDVRVAAQYPNLKLVLTCSIGTDHLDVDELRALGVMVCNNPTYCVDEVADHALACVLAGWRQLWTLGAAVRSGEWNGETMLRRFDEQRLGIIGIGRIGRALAKRALALGIDVVAYDPIAQPADGVAQVALEDLLATSDAVSIHAPSRPGAKPILGAHEIAMMKPDAVLVNASRAGVVDIDAVTTALRHDRLGTAAFDVWEPEPPQVGDERLTARGLLVTPHVGWSSPAALTAYYVESIETLRAVLIRGEEPLARVA